MNPIVLIAGITFYILSIVAALLLAVAAHRFGISAVKKLIAAHFMLIALFIAAIAISRFAAFKIQSLSYMSIGVLCSGLILSGLVMRLPFSKVIKAYFFIYIISIVLFALSPSKLFSFVVTGHFYSNSANRFSISQNYYLESQQALILRSDTAIRYKIYQRIGYFNKTIVRDINFGFRVDSLITLQFEKNKYAILRGYQLHGSKPDSADIKIDLQNSLKSNSITRRQ